MQGKLDQVLAAIDSANAADPETAPDGSPKALLYGRRMSEELARLAPDASELLQIAARGQHIERWKSPRSTYPEGRDGYLAWRRDLAIFHGERVAGIMAEAGYGAGDRARVAAILRKERLKRDPEVQMLEDTICMVFLKFYFAGFADKHPFEKVVDIVAKTARKLSEGGRNRVLLEFDLPEELANAVRAA